MRRCKANHIVDIDTNMSVRNEEEDWKENGKYKMETVKGNFHKFITEGEGSYFYTMAIIEQEDGQIKIVPAGSVKFIDPPII